MNCIDVKSIKLLAGQDVTLVPLDKSCVPLSENPDQQPKRNEPFSHEMHLKIPLLSRGLKLSKSKPGC